MDLTREIRRLRIVGVVRSGAQVGSAKADVLAALTLWCASHPAVCARGRPAVDIRLGGGAAFMGH